MERVVVRRADPRDAPALAELAARTFRDTFGADNRPEDLALHLASSYGAERQLAEITASDVRTLVAERDGALVGFAQLRRGEPPACVTTADPVELWRFYLDRSWHGRGRCLMDAALAEADAMGAGSVWLGVWERNPRAAAFYRKVGFVEVGAHEFRVGTDPQNDLIFTLGR
jgi:GNAT superfamily N-acetyltransferase